MAEEKKRPAPETSHVGGRPEQIDDRIIVCGKDSELRSIFANMLNVSYTKDEIVLLLGMKETVGSDSDEVTVRVSDRISIGPSIAKRLHNQLKDLIHTYESKYGLIDQYSPQPSKLNRIPSQSAKPSFSRNEKLDEKTGLLFQIVKNLNVEVGFERSFKIVNGVLLNNRYLLGVSKKAVRQRADERLTDTCSLMGMPKTLLDIFKHYLPQGNYVHFGFEQNERTTVYKVYLEFFKTIKKEIKKNNNRPSPALLHLGLKWDVSDPTRQSLTRYTWHPWIPSDEILQRVSHILEPKQGEAARQAAEQLISVALARMPYRDILYLEVTEEGNPRLSFDINVYRANLQLAEIYPLLSMLCRRHSIAFDTFHSLYEGIKTKRLGHLAAGADREGKGFFTVYYGVEEKFGESSRGALLGDEGAPVQSKYSLPPRRRRIVRIEERDEKAGHLFRLVRDLRLPGGYEHSFKFLNRILLTDRFLFGVKRAKGSVGKDDAILNICQEIDMPQDYQKMFQSKINEANFALFGFEKNEKNRVYKAYLEFSDRLEQAVKQEPRPESVVIYNGFKWDVSDNSRKVVATYTAYPLFRAQDMAVRVANSFYGGSRNYPYPIVDDILDLAGTRTRPGELLYFETSEEGNPRNSFDINMYWANLQMAEIYPLLLSMARHYSIEIKLFEELYEGVKAQKFGHLSGGTDREGRDFLTVYFSEKGSTRR